MNLLPAKARLRMDRLGYVRVPATLDRLGQPARSVERWKHNSNPLNEARTYRGRQDFTRARVEPQFVSPVSGCKLIQRPDCWFCPDDGHAFPIVAGIPCLTVENAVLASKLNQF